MEPLGRIWIALTLFTWGGSATVAEAQEVRWEGRCAAEGAGLPGEVMALVGRSGDELSAFATVNGEETLHLDLVLSRDGAPIGERAFDGADCVELVRAAALVVALAIDPEVGAPEAAVNVATVMDEPAPVATRPAAEALAPPPQRAASTSRPARNASSAEAVHRARSRGRAGGGGDAESVAPEVETTAEATSASASTPWHPELSVGAGFALDVGALPNAAPGVEATIGIALGPLRLEGGARVFFEQESGLGQHPTGRGHFGMAAGSLGACLPLDYGALTVGPCLGLEVGAIWGAATGVTDPGSDEKPWVAPNASGLLALDVASWLRLRLDLGVSVPLVRTEFIVDGIGPVHASSPVTFRGALGAEVHFR